MEKYYITTAIAYASAIPHIGNVYEAIFSDAIARFKRLDGYDVLFQTGTDEHGQKIASMAKENGLEPQAYVDFITSEIKRIYDRVNISYDKFVRTTNNDHVFSVQKIFDKLYEQGDIYLGEYEGWYSISEEAFINEKDLIDGKTPNGDIPVWTKEEVYFLKLGKYQKRLLEHIENNPGFIEPLSRKNEMIQNFLKEPLPDLSVSRTSFSWGIPVDFAKGHVVYVWIDALSNYITSLGYVPETEETKEFVKYWPANIHVIGKDILRFHTIYWPIILMALNIELPKKIFGHPWILFNKNKMSKSTGNVMYTDELVEYFGVDPIRYYVLHEIPYAQDGNITYELLIERNNSDLANTIGNLLNRTIGMIHKYRQGFIKKTILEEPFELDLKEHALKTLNKVRKNIENIKIADALEEVVQLARLGNKYIDVSEPWVLNKDESKKEILDHVLYTLLETIRFIAVLLQPFLPDTALKMAAQIKEENLSFSTIETFGYLNSKELDKAIPIFERYDMDKKIEEILKAENKG